MTQKKPPVNPRSTFEKDTDSTKEFKGGKAAGHTPGATAGGRQTKQMPSQKGPSNKGKN